jgi:hypothetical protein
VEVPGLPKSTYDTLGIWKVYDARKGGKAMLGEVTGYCCSLHSHWCSNACNVAQSRPLDTVAFFRLLPTGPLHIPLLLLFSCSHCNQSPPIPPCHRNLIIKCHTKFVNTGPILVVYYYSRNVLYPPPKAHSCYGSML